jgi:transcription elongation factor GreA
VSETTVGDAKDGGHNPLVAAAQQSGMDGLESAWLELLDDPPAAKVFLEGLDAVAEGQRREAGSLLQLLLDAYRERNAHADILDVASVLVDHRHKVEDLMGLVRSSLESLYGQEEWFDAFALIAELEADDVSETLDRFNKLLSLLPGGAVYHATGWGEGVVTAIDLEQESLEVQFRSDGRSRLMPFRTAFDVLRVLDSDDLRARILIDLDALKSDAQDDPAKLIRAVARLNKNRAGAREIKQWLSGTVIEASAWASWWRKAKIAAARDPWLAVENPARPLFVLRSRALSPEDEVRTALSRATDLAGLLDVVRGPLSLDPAADLLAEMLSGVAAGAENEPTPMSAHVEAQLVLARHGHHERSVAGATICDYLKEGVGFGQLASSLAPASLRREAFEAFVTARPGLWTDDIIGDLPSLPVSLIDTVAERLVSEGRGEALANRLRIFLMTPSRQPGTVVHLCKRFAAGLLDDVEGAPSLADVVMGLLHLAETQAPKADRDDKAAKAVMKGVLDLASAKRHNLVKRFVEECKRPAMERAMGVVLRCRTMPTELSDPLKTACVARFPDLAPRDETPFWESNNIFSTEAGLARRNEEYRVLLEEKIPENSESIGKAAAFGDLSENFEWTAAIEQQRQLTEKAAAMEAELKLARSIEDQELEGGVVSPGTRVSYEQQGVSHTISILGPWDYGDDVVSYMAPVAAGMLGATVGDSATLDLPDGSVEVKVTAVEQLV